MQRELAVTVSNSNQGVTPLESIDAIVKAGFRHVFVEWYDKPWEITQEQQLDHARSLGLHVVFAHLGYQGINNLWLENAEGEALVERYKQDLRNCKAHGIDLVCMHLTSKSKAPGPNLTGIRRLRLIAEEAERLGMRIAFENTKIKGYQEYVLEHLPYSHIGICLDSGHLHAHFKDELDFDLFKEKIFCVHLHDNFGMEDEHLLPFDGSIDWPWLMGRLNDCGYTGPVSMELVYQNGYGGEDLVSFYKKGLLAGQKLERLLNRKESSTLY